MSVKSLIAFMHSLEGDSASEGQLNIGASDEQVVAVAADRGFDFSLDEVRSVAQRARDITANDRELGDEELSSVAGGAGTSFDILRSLNSKALIQIADQLRD